jgi:hypothetical protein
MGKEKSSVSDELITNSLSSALSTETHFGFDGLLKKNIPCPLTLTPTSLVSRKIWKRGIKPPQYICSLNYYRQTTLLKN